MYWYNCGFLKLPSLNSTQNSSAIIWETLDVYSHWAPGLQEAAANRFDELVNPVRKNETVEKKG